MKMQDIDQTVNHDDDYIIFFDALKLSGWGSSKLYRAALLGEVRHIATHGHALMYNRSDIERLMRQAGQRKRTTAAK